MTRMTTQGHESRVLLNHAASKTCLTAFCTAISRRVIEPGLQNVDLALPAYLPFCGMLPRLLGARSPDLTGYWGPAALLGTKSPA